MSQPLNPYYFAPFGQEVVRKPAHEWQVPPSYSGYLKCHLIPLSPLCVKHIFTSADCRVYVPGSSIKGMLRQLISTLAAGCAEYIDRDYYYLRDKLYHKDIPGNAYAIEYFVTHGHFPDGEYNQSQFRSCAQLIEETNPTLVTLCRVCHLFGYTAKKSALAGRIRVADTNRLRVALEKETVLRLDEPRVYRWSFYFENQLTAANEKIYPDPPVKPPKMLTAYPSGLGKIQGARQPESAAPRSHKIVHLKDGTYRGRKFYRHSLGGKISEPPPETATQDIFALPPQPQTQFDFDVHFERLTADDLGLLIFALVLQSNPPADKNLQDNLRHKLGYGKPLGLGSVQIVADKLMLRATDAYEEFAKPIWQDATDQIYESRNRFLDNSNILHSPAYQQLQKIWQWPGAPIDYPELKKFFGNKKNRYVSLQDYNAGNWPPPEETVATSEGSSATVKLGDLEKKKKEKKAAQLDKILEVDLEVDPKSKKSFVTIHGTRLKVEKISLFPGHSTRIRVKIEYDKTDKPSKAIFKEWR
jgi:CRISPR/Cas system CSM-associated protein Csm3 (group 7 of RAMP superfamily)